MPKLFEGPCITLVGVADSCGFETADGPVACLDNDENAIVERAAVYGAQDAVDKKSDEFSPVESAMVEELINSVLMFSGYCHAKPAQKDV